MGMNKCPWLTAYLALEGAVAQIESSTMAEELRACMDLVWLMLSDEDRAELDQRGTK